MRPLAPTDVETAEAVRTHLGRPAGATGARPGATTRLGAARVGGRGLGADTVVERR